MLHYQSDCPEGKTIINPFKLLDYHGDFVSWKMKNIPTYHPDNTAVCQRGSLKGAF